MHLTKTFKSSLGLILITYCAGLNTFTLNAMMSGRHNKSFRTAMTSRQQTALRSFPPIRRFRPIYLCTYILLWSSFYRSLSRVRAKEEMKITVPSALLTAFLFGGSGRNGGIARAFSSSSYSYSSSVTAIGGVTRRRSVMSSNTKTTTTTIINYYSTSALRSSASAAGTRVTTTTNARPTKLTSTTTTTTMMEEMINKTDVFIFDCDGVIWRVRRDTIFVVLLARVVMFIRNIFKIYSPWRVVHGKKCG